MNANPEAQDLTIPLQGPTGPQKKERLETLIRMLETAYDERRIDVTYDRHGVSVSFALPRDGSPRARLGYALGVQVIDINQHVGLLSGQRLEPPLDW